jgi:hypothetical protein
LKLRELLLLHLDEIIRRLPLRLLMVAVIGHLDQLSPRSLGSDPNMIARLNA